MSADNEYVITGALMKCSEGASPMPFKATPRTSKIAGLLAGNELDIAPILNIPSFVICKKLTQMANGVPVPCVPAPTQWQDTYQAKVGGGKALLKMSCIQCTAGQGKIEFITSGQAPLPPEVVEDIQLTEQKGKEALEQAQKEKNAIGEAGFVEGLIPIWGSGRDLIHSVQTGDGFGMALNAGFLVWDAVSLVAGALSFGTATAVMMGAKAGIRTALKAAGKVVVSVAKKQGAELLAKTAKAGKNIAALAKNFTAQIPSICFATSCFPAGTPIAVKGGFKNIEDIKTGDEVWSWNEEKAEIGLKRVVNTMVREADALIELGFGKERFKATPEHPFWVGDPEKGQWKEAGDLAEGDQVWLLDKRNVALSVVDHQPQPGNKIKVYNFEVEGWHTYFIGWWMVLVHNWCLLMKAKAGIKYAKDILNGQLFDKAMRKAYKYSQIKLSNKKVLDVLVPGKEIISHKYTQLGKDTGISFNTAKKYIDEIRQKYANQMTESRKLSKQVSTKDLKKILEVPPQKEAIADDIVKYASDNDVQIRQISGEALKVFNKIKFWQ